ncbi:HAMP domain-containing protein [Oscillochloris sp. ZM17-4]|uniref:sensor histidine kinase n=1 Tax=Oscillochloris sp. ZM17-4 TaxID=2866714 RepID=UPI001C73B567|nr:ATP-binding protein [Oscillochloris sp. ZM17-4]MBX0331476.1 HAMP domain-containing protein [Oscillochloris sp. ZM17-4]
MSRLWVRFSLMIAGVLFLVFFMQFLSIIVPHAARLEPPDIGGPPDSEIARRLIDFMILSLLIGLAGGVLISRVVSAPVSAMARAARRISEGDLAVTVPVRGSYELEELARAFNTMAADLRHAEDLRRNLMADVSHELRTPLAALEANLRAALDRVAPLDDVTIAHLYGQTRHLARLVNDLRDLALAESHKLPLERQPTDMSALIAETIQAIAPLAEEKGISLTAAAEGLPELWVDPVRIRQVLFNLLTNALRHTPEGGAVTVTGAYRAGVMRLEVRDSGEGVEPEHLDAIFDRFYRGDQSRSRATGGTGLGLAIVRALCEAHGGAVSVQSAGRRRGSCFVVTLPG